MFSVIIPTFNNIEYLKICLNSLKKNSKFKHQIIVHINEGSDGTKEFVEKNNIKFTYTDYNAGITKGMNLGAKEATTDYILYAHDDFYFCPKWDYYLKEEINKIPHKNFYLSGTMLNLGHVRSDCGENLENFNEKKLLDDLKNMNIDDFQGSTWSPTLVHKNLWDKVGGFSEEFFAGSGSDPDFNMKLWNEGVRIFKGVGKSRVYHFGSIVSRKENDKNVVNWRGSRGGKIFLLKWGFSIKFFIRFYLKGCRNINSRIICNKYDGPLKDPNKNLIFYFHLFLNKINYLYNWTVWKMK